MQDASILRANLTGHKDQVVTRTPALRPSRLRRVRQRYAQLLQPRFCAHRLPPASSCTRRLLHRFAVIVMLPASGSTTHAVRLQLRTRPRPVP
jgi:hypothetical protein